MPLRDILEEVRGAVAPTPKDYREAGLLEAPAQVEQPQVNEQTYGGILQSFEEGRADSPELATPLTSFIDEFQEVTQEEDVAARARHDQIQDMGFFETVGHLAKGTTTGYVVSNLAQYLEDAEVSAFDNPELAQPVTPEYISNLMFTHGLPFDNRYVEAMRKAGTKGEALQTFYRLQDHAESARIASYSPLTNFAVQALDPIENLALVGATIATGGIGAPAALSARTVSLFGKTTRTVIQTGNAARLTGLTRAGAQAGAITGAIALGAYSDRETSALDYISAGALVMAGRYYFGPERKLAKRGLDKAVRNGDAQAATELALPSAAITNPNAPVVYTKFTPVEKPIRTRAQALQDLPMPTKPTLAASTRDAALTPEVLSAASRAPLAQRALPRFRKRLEELKQTASELTALRAERAGLGNRPTRSSLPSKLPKGVSARRAVEQARREYVAKVADLDTRIMQAEGARASIARTERAIASAEYAVRAAERVGRVNAGEFSAAERAAGKKLHKERMQDYTEEAHLVAQQRREALADVSVMEASGIQRLEAIEQASLPKPLQEAAEAVEAPIEGSLVADGAGGRLHVPMQAFRGIVSEYEKITMGIPAVRNLMGKLLDDPLMRDGFSGRNAASYLRIYRNQAQGYLQRWETSLDDYVRTLTGESKLKSLNGFSSKHEARRLEVEEEIGEFLLERNAAAQVGDTIPRHHNPEIQKLIDIYEDANAFSIDLAKKSGLEGADRVTAHAGYFHRSYSYDKLRRITNAYGEDAAKSLLTASVAQGLRVETAYAQHIANAIYTRTVNKGTSARHDFMGQLGKVETDNIIDTMRAEGVSEAAINHIRGRLEQSLDTATGTQYLRERLPLDMHVRVPVSDGSSIGMTDLIDMDLSRLLENTLQGMTGRSALAKVGIGGTDSAIERFRQQYMDLLNKTGASTKSIQDANKQLDYVIGDFTGIRPDDAILSEAYTTGASLASASMLGSTGLLQVAEFGVIAQRYGMVATMQEILQRTPGIKQGLEAIGKDKDLANDFMEVVGLDLSRDMRIRSWKRQVEVGQTATAWHNKYAYMMQQATPTVTGQRMVHRAQANIVINLGLKRVLAATKGDAAALDELLQYMPELDRASLLGEVKAAARYNKQGRLTDFGWDQLSDQALEDLTNVVTRMADDALLHGRVGQGASFTRTAVGRILFQFMSYSSYAHNKLLRGTLHNKGAIGLASLLVHQYPIMFAMTYLNEIRRGEIPDLDNEADLMRVAARALSYSAVLGLSDLALSVVGGGRGGVSAMDALGSGGALLQIPGEIVDGNALRALGLSAEAVSGVSFLGAVPGAQALINMTKE